MTTKLVTYAYIRSECDISKNVDDQELDSKIRWAQDQLKMMLGRQFYDQIVSQYEANTLTQVDNPDNYALYDPYIKQFLAWETNAEWTVKANFKDTRSGFRVHREDNSEPVSDAQLAILIKDAKSKASTYKNELLAFLADEQRADSSKYPLYEQSCDAGYSNSAKISAVIKRRTTNYDINRQIERGS